MILPTMVPALAKGFCLELVLPSLAHVLTYPCALHYKSFRLLSDSRILAHSMAYGMFSPLCSIPRLIAIAGADHCLPMSQSDSSIAHIDPASPALVLRVSQSSTALSPSSVSVTFACLTTPASPVIDNLPNAAQASPSPPVGSNGATYTPDSELNASMQSPNASNPNLDVDPQILEALKNKDRIFVLKLGEAFEALIKERRCVSTSYPVFACILAGVRSLFLCVANG